MTSNDRPVGYAWLIRHYALSTSPLSHESCIGARARSDATVPGVVQEVFLPVYWPGDDPFDHLVFALKYDELNLDALRQVFGMLGPAQVLRYIEKQPNGKYARQIGYLYEFLTGEQLDLSASIGGAYIDLLDPDNYLVSPRRDKNARWHINDNLLGSARFCPVVRKTAAIKSLQAFAPSGALQPGCRPAAGYYES